MANWTKVFESVFTGLLTGGSSVLATTLAVFRDFRKRLTALEEKLGSPEPHSTGLYALIDAAVTRLETEHRTIRREIDSWDEAPPTWATRLLNKSRSNSAMGLEAHKELEENVERKARQYRQLEEEFRQLRRELDERSIEGACVSKSEYETDSKSRAEEILKIRESLATTNGLLRGVMAALEFIDPLKNPRDK